MAEEVSVEIILDDIMVNFLNESSKEFLEKRWMESLVIFRRGTLEGIFRGFPAGTPGASLELVPKLRLPSKFIIRLR